MLVRTPLQSRQIAGMDQVLELVQDGLAKARTRAELREITGLSDSSLRWRVNELGADAVERWKALRFGGRGRIFVGSKEPPRALTPVERQEAWDKIVAEAVDDCLSVAPLNGIASRAAFVRVMVAIYAILGTMNWDRGWIRSIMIALAKRGHQTTPASVRWHRTSLASNPGYYEEMPHVDQEALSDLYDLAHRN